MRIVALAAAALIGATTGAVIAAPTASAADFYTPPAKVPATPGTIIRSDSMPLLLQIPGMPNQWPGDAQRVMYASRYQDGTPAAVTGTYVQPTARWSGKGPQPTVVIGPGTIGQGDQCAPSKMMSFPMSVDLNQRSIGVNYFALEMNYLLLHGVRVFVTDYVGLGTPGIHTYVNRVEEGHAMLDGARAALKLAGAPANSPVGFEGYSQGGGAAASAAEMAQTYAPDLNVKGTYAGAPPADLGSVLRQVDGTAIVGVIGFAINGLEARYPLVRKVVDQETSPAGKAALERLSNSCIGDIILQYPFQHTSSWTRSGESLSQVIGRHPELDPVFAEQRIGGLKPNAPVFVEGATNDDIIPYGQVKQLVGDWRAKGAKVDFVTNTTPPVFPGLVINHAVPMLTTLLPGENFLLDQFNR